MTQTEEVLPTPLPFELDFWTYTGIGQQVQAMVNDGTLPFDTTFRLASIGICEPDPRDRSERPERLMWSVLKDIVDNEGDAEKLRDDTHELLWGQRPDAIIDWYQGSNHPSYTMLDPMYYDMVDLAQVVRSRRKDEGKTVTEVPERVWLTPKEFEFQRCLGLARPIWRVIVQRTHPEWLEQPRQYYSPTVSFNQIYYPSDKAMAFRNIGQAVISDAVLLGMYHEAKETGVRGIGPVGREDLRSLLAEEHPELY